MPRRILVSTLAIILVIEAAAHLTSHSSPFIPIQGDGKSDTASLQRPRAFEKALERAANRGRMAAELALVDTRQGRFTPNSPTTEAVVKTEAAPKGEKEREQIARKEVMVTKEVAVAPGSMLPAHKGLAKKQQDAPTAKWTPPHYETWKPLQVYGPPLPPERLRIQRMANRLLQDLHAGRLSLVIDERDGEQLRTLERDGLYCWPAPPSGVVVRSASQHNVLEGTAGEDTEALPGEKRLASRGTLPRRFPTANPADDPEFDPCHNPPAPALLRMLTGLSSHSTPERPLEILSLLRPPYRFGAYVHVGPANPHSLGLAVDIGAYDGHPFRQTLPEECVAGTLALLRDLPPGRYRLGMPKAPDPNADLPPALIALRNRSGLPASGSPEDNVPQRQADENTEDRNHSGHSATVSRHVSLTESNGTEEPQGTIGCVVAALYGLQACRVQTIWPFFPAPYTEMVAPEKENADDTVSIASSTKSSSGMAGSLKRVVRFQNEAYAPESGLNDVRLREALAAARERGVDVIALFPDGVDHIHIDVRQNP